MNHLPSFKPMVIVNSGECVFRKLIEPSYGFFSIFRFYHLKFPFVRLLSAEIARLGACHFKVFFQPAGHTYFTTMVNGNSRSKMITFFTYR